MISNVNKCEDYVIYIEYSYIASYILEYVLSMSVSLHNKDVGKSKSSYMN